MRDKVFYLLAAASAALLSWNLYKIFFVLGDEKDQGSIWRIFHFHVPSNILGIPVFALLIWLHLPVWKYFGSLIDALSLGFHRRVAKQFRRTPART